nr:ester cyclase [Halobaculum halophilum]
MTTPTTKEHRRLARRVPEEIATERNLDLIDEVYAEGAVEHGPMGEREGREAIREQFDQFLSAFPDFTATVRDVVAEDDTVAMRVTLRGTHEGPFLGYEPTGQTFEVGTMVFTRTEDGMIAERWIQLDMLGLLRQLGIADPSTR